MFLSAKVNQIEQGAVYQDSVYDWWIHLETTDGTSLKVFDYGHVIDLEPSCQQIIELGKTYDFLILAFGISNARYCHQDKVVKKLYTAEIINPDWKASAKVCDSYKVKPLKDYILAKTSWGRVLLDKKDYQREIGCEANVFDCIEWDIGRFDLLGINKNMK